MDEDQNIEYKQSWRDEYLKWISTPQITPQVAHTTLVALQIMGSNELLNRLLDLFKEKAECSFIEIKEGLGFSDRMYVSNVMY